MCVRHASNIQSAIALSSGESEWHGLVRGCPTALGLQSVLCDGDTLAEADVMWDSSVARGLTSRQGFARARHVQPRRLWVQERVREGHRGYGQESR